MPDNYLLKYKGTYRIMPEICTDTNDVPRNHLDEIEESYGDLYVLCANGLKIYHNTRDVLTAYIPTLQRAHNIMKALKEKEILYFNVKEADTEVFFNFKSKDMSEVAKIMKARTGGASISPFSVKNLPKEKVEISSNKIDEYKKITSRVDKDNYLLINRISTTFLLSVLEKKYKLDDKTFNYKTDMKKLKLARDKKGYIYKKGMFDEYLVFLDKEITKFYDKCGEK